MLKNYKRILSEIILTIAGVLIFRSLWTLMDKIPLFNNTIILIISLIIGTIGTVIALNELIPKHWWQK